ncbi:hypothetical protein ACQP1O_38400 [Nocardia sp. CA-151230]|uniref:hypothetical protein n=1 Tax=Nocardia sp. CA-151230 TaxID=3239982 RepID=UPI003D928BDB
MTDSNAFARAGQVLADVASLLDHHPAQSDPKRGRPAGAGYGHLLRSSVALCYTAWEVYVEEALVETVQLLVADGEPDELPVAFRTWVAELKPSPWTFVGDAWRYQVVELVRERIEGDDTGRYGFNTASVGKVTGLYKEVLGYSPLQDIKWQSKSNAAVRRDISLLVQVRGEIVHKGTTPGSLNLKGVRDWSSFVGRLCEKFDEQLGQFRADVSSGSKN